MNTVELIKISICKTPRGTSALVEGKSPGVLDCDLEEIVRRASGIVLPESGRINILNLFFQHLPGGGSVIGRLVPVMDEHRTQTVPGKACVQCLSVTPQTLADFGNNPVVLYQSILNSGSLSAFLTTDSQLSSLTLRERNATFDWELVRGLTVHPGSNSLAILLDSVLFEIETFFSGRLSGVHLLAGLFNLLPPSWRPELTFTTGLTFRDEYDFRIIGIPTENTALIESCKCAKLAYFDLDSHRSDYQVIGGWAILVQEILDSDRLSFLVPRLLKRRIPPKSNDDNLISSADEVNSIGFAWLEEYEKLNKAKSEKNRSRAEDESVPGACDDTEKLPKRLESEIPYPGHHPSMISHEEPLLHYIPGNRIFSPYQRLLASWPQYRNTFLQFDSLIAHVLKYERGAIEALRDFWHILEEELDESVLWGIREEYIHYVQASLMDDGDHEAVPAQRSLYTLEILDILVN